MEHFIIDAHSHLWLRQDTVVNGRRISPLSSGRADFMGEERQMLPPFMIDGRNTAEVFLSNMDYAQVAAAVVVQEFIDGEQNEYLAEVARKYPDRFFVNGMCEFREPGFLPQAVGLMDAGFRGLAIPAHRLPLEGREARVAQLARDDGAFQGDGAPWSDSLYHTRRRRHAGGRDERGHRGVSRPESGHRSFRHGHHRRLDGADKARSRGQRHGRGRRHHVAFQLGVLSLPSAVRAIKEAAAEVGMDKLMWGSDYPRTITAITYRMSYDFITKSKELTDEEKHLFLGDNAMRFYGFRNLPVLPYVKNMSE